jgi:hypothetical protein
VLDADFTGITARLGGVGVQLYADADALHSALAALPLRSGRP